jgi:alkylated DNA repair dioxygenase AlkB
MLPEGFILVEDFVSPEEESKLIRYIRDIEFGQVRMHGVVARRRVAQFGWHYSFDSYRLTPARPMPPELECVRERAAALAGVKSSEFSEALVTEYQPGAGIGWHRDAPPFGIVAGISLAGRCRMRFQRGSGADRVTTAIELAPRSIYLMTGPARSEWQHTIPPTKELRYSITFRTLRKPVRTETE